MTHKKLICPHQLRIPPSQFSWLDQRLVRDNYIDQCDHQALALYLFLVTVADARGLSYYADVTLGRRLALKPSALEQARQSLITAQLIAYQTPLYQVLALSGVERSPTERSPTERSPTERSPTEPQTVTNSDVVQRTQKNRPLALAELLKLASTNASQHLDDASDD